MSQTVVHFWGSSCLACAAKSCIGSALLAAETFDKTAELCTRSSSK